MSMLERATDVFKSQKVAIHNVVIIRALWLCMIAIKLMMKLMVLQYLYSKSRTTSIFA